MKKRKIVIVNQSTGDLTIDVVNAFADRYDEVVLVAGSIKVMERNLSTKVKVDKIKAYDRSSTLKRMIAWLIGFIQIFGKLLVKYHGYEVMYFTNPPMSCWSSLFLRSKFSIVEYDIYPDALMNIGIKKTNPIFKLWKAINRRLFAKADRIITLSEGMADTLEEYGGRNKMKVIPNWCTSSKLHPIDKKENPFVKQYGLEDKFVIMYSGNIGYTHQVEYLVDVAEQLKDDKGIVFLVIGEGMKKQEVMDRAKAKGLDSFLFLTWQTVERLPYSLNAADLGVVTLNDFTAKLSVPSKTYNLLACGKPLLVISPRDSEMNNILAKYHNGACFEKTEVKEMAEFICGLKNLPAEYQRLCDNSLSASKDFTYKNAEQYVN